MLLLLLVSTATFGAGGFVAGEQGRFLGIALDAEGRAVAAGWSGGAAVVVRYAEDGSRDPSFAAAGIEGARFHDVAIDGEGRIVAAGTIASRTLVARFLADGALDPSFGEGGLARGRGRGPGGGSFLHDRGDADAEAIDRFESVAVDSRGRLVTAGVARGFRPSSWSGWFFCRWFDLDRCWSYENTSILARFLPGGALDPSFAGTGFILGNRGARWHVGPHDELMQAIILDGDRIAAAGWAAGETYHDERTIVARYREDGSDDGFELSAARSFAGGSMEVLYGLARDGDRIVTCGFSFDDARHMMALIKRYDRDLRLIDHAVTSARQLADSDVEDFVKCAVDADGRVSGVGFTDDEWRQNDEPDRALLARIRADGSVEARFSSFADGRSLFGERKNDGFYDVAIDARGRTWAVGSSNGRTLIARFRPDLRLDSNAALDPDP